MSWDRRQKVFPYTKNTYKRLDSQDAIRYYVGMATINSSRPAPIEGVGNLKGLGDTTEVVTATEGTCPECGWTTLHLQSVGVVTAGCAHMRDAHPDIAAARYYFPEDAWQRANDDWNLTKVSAVVVPDSGQLALFSNNDTIEVAR